MVIRQRKHIEDVEGFNDELARKHDIDDYYRRSMLPIRLIERRRLAIIRELIAAKSHDEILEVGCGGGHVLQMFPQARLTGLDVSSLMLDKARRNLRGYRVTLLVHPDIAALLYDEERTGIEELERQFEKQITITARNTFHQEQFEIVVG